MSTSKDVVRAFELTSVLAFSQERYTNTQHCHPCRRSASRSLAARPAHLVVVPETRTQLTQGDVWTCDTCFTRWYTRSLRASTGSWSRWCRSSRFDGARGSSHGGRSTVWTCSTSQHFGRELRDQSLSHWRSLQRTAAEDAMGKTVFDGRHHGGGRN